MLGREITANDQQTLVDEALAELKEGEGARGVVQANRQAVHIIDVDDAGIWRDVDFPEDLSNGG